MLGRPIIFWFATIVFLPVTFQNQCKHEGDLSEKVSDKQTVIKLILKVIAPECGRKREGRKEGQGRQGEEEVNKGKGWKNKKGKGGRERKRRQKKKRKGENSKINTNVSARRREREKKRKKKKKTPPSMEFSSQEYWSGLPFPSLGDLPNPGIEPVSPAFQADTLPSEPPGNPQCLKRVI